MKTLQRLSAVTLLAVAFTVQAFAGEITTGVTAPPPPPPSLTGEITTGVMSDDQTGGETAAADSVREVVLSLLGGVLTLF